MENGSFPSIMRMEGRWMVASGGYPLARRVPEGPLEVYPDLLQPDFPVPLSLMGSRWGGPSHPLPMTPLPYFLVSTTLLLLELWEATCLRPCPWQMQPPCRPNCKGCKMTWEVATRPREPWCVMGCLSHIWQALASWVVIFWPVFLPRWAPPYHITSWRIMGKRGRTDPP